MNNQSDSKFNKSLDELLSTVGVGVWDWDLRTNQVKYSEAWAQILGYTAKELAPVAKTWEDMLLPEDLDYANEKIDGHLKGIYPIYEAEFRMVCKDGSIIWAQDKGQVSEVDENGTPIRFMGVLQNVDRLKSTELMLLENQESLDWAVQVASFGTWDWDLPSNTIRYNDEYLKMFGRSREDITGSIEEWTSFNHPEDLVKASKLLDAYISGEIPKYECELRMQHRDGSYIWTRDMGKIVARDADGKPTRLIGGHLNIDELKRSQMLLTDALKDLEHVNSYLTYQMQDRNDEIIEQDKMLWTVNQISRKLLSFQPNERFEDLVYECLHLLGETTGINRVSIWKDIVDEDGQNCCTQMYEWVNNTTPIKGNKQYERISYANLPSFSQAIESDCCLNSLLSSLSPSEKTILGSLGIKTILIAPISVNGNRWGFIGVDNIEKEQLFTATEENMLHMSGSMLANTIANMDAQTALREMEDRTQSILNAMPLCCNLWNSDLENTICNDEAVRLFDLSSQEEYLERFHELSPEFQPCGKLSRELSAEYISLTFEEGYCRFEWMHQKPDGTPIPAEITLVRIKRRDGFIVAGYTRDLREEREMLDALQSKEDDLRTARDEALLSSKAKSNFLANMSHEIRTPMNAISGLAEIIARETHDAKTVQHAKGIKTACGNLINLINDILDISKIESGKLEIYNAPYELASLLNDVITISRMRLGSKPLMFITDIDSRLPSKLIGDELRIKQILINMLSNAIKFTHEGYIALRVSGACENNQFILTFSIKDSGSGIKKSDLHRLFAEFERVNTTKNRNIEGTGLGLAISKQLCEMMNGQISVDSKFGIGSEFTAIIPQEITEYERLAQVTAPKNVLLYEPRELYRHSIFESLINLDCTCVPCSNQSELYDNINAGSYDYVLTAFLHVAKVQSLIRKNNMNVPIAAFADYGEDLHDTDVDYILFPVNCMLLANILNGRHVDGDFSGRASEYGNFIAPEARVLVVDDNPVNLQVARGLMEPYQFHIDTAENGIQAVNMVKENRYDIVFMDHMMPEMDGIDATIAIRKLKKQYYQDLPIIALTANALVGTREMFIREGMNDFIAKPIEVNKLAHVILKYLPKIKVITENKKNVTVSEKEALAFDIKGVDTERGIKAIGGSPKNYFQIISLYYEDGVKKCSSLVGHIKKNNISAFRTEIHSLKSTSATIGAQEVYTLAAKLEDAAQRNDVDFINSNLDEFLTCLKNILEAIRPNLKNSAYVDSSASNDDNPAGDLACLKENITALYTAAEYANIGQIETIFATLHKFKWSKSIMDELVNIEKCLAVFDYDGVLDAATRLKDL